MKLEVMVVPVSDVDRAKTFYGNLGWRLDADITWGDVRVVQFTPPGSPASIHVGSGNTSATPGSVDGLFLIVSDIQAARDELIAHGADVSPVFHRDDNGVIVDGPAADHATYGSYASFSDPDGNRWLLQEITTRFPGRIDSSTTAFASVGDLAQGLRRAAAAHGEHEARTGQADANWPDWYARYMVAEQSGGELPR